MQLVLRVTFLQKLWLPELCISLHWVNTAWVQFAGVCPPNLSQKTEKEQCDSGLQRPISGTKQKASDEWKYPDPGKEADLSCSGSLIRRSGGVTLRPNCNWKTSSLVLGFGLSTDDAGNWETGSTEGPWQRISWPVKHFYCQWCSENYMSCRSNQGRLFPSGGWKLCFILVLLGGGRRVGRKGKWYSVTSNQSMGWLYTLFSTCCSVCSMLICVTVTQLHNFWSGRYWKETLVKDDLCTVVPEARAVKSSRRQSSICGKQDSGL